MIVVVICLIIVHLVVYSSIRIRYLSPRSSRVDLLFADPSFITEQNQRQTSLNQLTSARLLLQSIELNITNMRNTLTTNTTVRDGLKSQYDNLLLYLEKKL